MTPDTANAVHRRLAHRALRVLRAIAELLRESAGALGFGKPTASELTAAARLADGIGEVPHDDSASPALRLRQYEVSCEVMLLVHTLRTFAAHCLDQHPSSEVMTRIHGQRALAELAVHRLLDLLQTDAPYIGARGYTPNDILPRTKRRAIGDSVTCSECGLTNGDHKHGCSNDPHAEVLTSPVPLQTMADVQSDGGKPPSVMELVSVIGYDGQPTTEPRIVERTAAETVAVDLAHEFRRDTAAANECVCGQPEAHPTHITREIAVECEDFHAFRPTNDDKDTCLCGESRLWQGHGHRIVGGE